MATIEEKEKRIKEAFSDENYTVEVESFEDAHNRNLVHHVTAYEDGEKYASEIRSSFDGSIGQEKLDWLVGSFPYSGEDTASEEADETYGDTEQIE